MKIRRYCAAELSPSLTPALSLTPLPNPNLYLNPNLLRRLLPLLALALLGQRAWPAEPLPVIAAKYPVRVQRNVLIPTRDGTKLAADLVRPDADGKFPAIIEYMPYRKDDVSSAREEDHRYFAERGFVGVRLDVRGTGGSEGVNTDEYMPVEQADGYDAVEWCAKQPWCNGRVGMFGSSYGGFTAVQVAMHQPPSLKAIVPLYATDDRYADDCHYTRGGNMRMYYDVGTYGGSMVAMNALPPSADGDRWAELWQERLERNEPYLLKWLKHQTDGGYWRTASLRPGYDRIKCPVFLVAGWHDGYANPMLRMYTQLKTPKKLLVGPWVHQRPNFSVPGPNVDYLNEVCRFFAHWLRDEDTGMMKEPPVAAYLMGHVRPERTLATLPGRWRNDVEFPVAGMREQVFYLQEGGKLTKDDPAAREAHDEFEYHPTLGRANAFWSGGGISSYLAEDQRADEAYSLVYTSPPFEKDLAVFGWPKVVLHGSSSARVATFVAKLADVAPDGTSCLIQDGSLNATRRRSLAEPTPLVPGEVYELDIPVNPIGWVIKRGHRLRLAVSGADFPNLWPTPQKCRSRVYHGGGYRSRVSLPVVPDSALEPPRFLPPPQMPAVAKVYPKAPRQEVRHDQLTGVYSVEYASGVTRVLPDGRGSIRYDQKFRCAASSKDPGQASVVGTHTYTINRGDGTYEVVAESSIRATATAFQITIVLNVYRNGKPFFQKKWLATEPRRGL